MKSQVVGLLRLLPLLLRPGFYRCISLPAVCLHRTNHRPQSFPHGVPSPPSRSPSSHSETASTLYRIHVDPPSLGSLHHTFTFSSRISPPTAGMRPVRSSTTLPSPLTPSHSCCSLSTQSYRSRLLNDHRSVQWEPFVCPGGPNC